MDKLNGRGISELIQEKEATTYVRRMAQDAVYVVVVADTVDLLGEGAEEGVAARKDFRGKKNFFKTIAYIMASTVT